MLKSLFFSAIFSGLLVLALGCNDTAKAQNNSADLESNISSEGSMADADISVMDADQHSGHDHGSHDHGGHDHSGSDNETDDVTKATSPASGQPYPLATCPISGEELGSMGDPIHINHEGRDIALCCKGCISKFEADPAKYIALIDEQIIAEQLASYPLTNCPVSGEELGSMGETIDRVYDNRLVRFCCEGCIEKFEADPATYFSKLDEAVIAAQSADYALDSCPVMGDRLDPASTVNYVVGNRLVKLCCEDCKQDVAANPAKYFKLIDAARAS